MSAGMGVVRLGPLSVRIRIRPLVAFAVLLVVALVLFCLSISAGSTWVAPATVVDALSGGSGQAVRYQVLGLRLPRAAIGTLAGAALALAGAFLQSIARNPLASPDVLGITTGASVGAAGVFILGWRVFDAPLTVSLPLAALIGGSIAAAAVFWASRGAAGGMRLVLVGVGVNAALLGLLHGLLVVGGTYDVLQVQVWLTGDLSSDAPRIAPLAVVLVVAAIIAVATSRSTAAMHLGDDIAHGVGVAVGRTRGVLLAGSVLAASAAVGAAGPLGFIALSAPQIARFLTRESRVPLGCTAVCGAILVLAADLVARTLFSGRVSVGLLTAIVGGPILISLMLRRLRSRA
ncbi:FecCD family ABC transporter permease [Rathayibacter tanaceti]|uniref:Iron chelate uptake ABC transporter family permease subunit n=2 Tax=Rathayibacter tanaceti TaxID=1671680 RepID=A0A166HRU1_9MICO|nr:iron ABC transporter permease [Rathayibacter tanaceti]KZX21066.1 putative siderophore transport system permease protein YfhA [Rathayibacter tanaceti]QHC55213.1 iron chelate uptake ABC transporter family permease subunit [Rathayibacter tanaceti]TCO36497.1 iron complex transport system permease protein [Rathayibacter tanaceti]